MKRIITLFLFCSALSADMLTPESSGNQWARFDPNLGILTEVQLSLSTRIGETFTFGPNQAYRPGQNDTVSGQLEATLTARVADKTVSNSKLVWGTGTSFLDLSCPLWLSGDWVTNLDAFQGDGNWNLDLSPSIDHQYIYWPTGVSMLAAQMVFLNPAVYVTYRYDPYPVEQFTSFARFEAPTAVPEPKMWALAGLALAGLVYRKKATA